MRDLIILGSTGSIGSQALEIVRAYPDQFRVVGLAAGSNQELAKRQAAEFGVKDLAFGVDETVGLIGRVSADVILNGITGAAGLLPTLAALKTKAILALANKESLIMGGELVKSAAAPGQIVPVDSEHSAIAQALLSGKSSEVKKLILTASGGPFRGFTNEQLENVTPAQAAKHPTWSMGSVITTNSATLVNKGLEVIEAHLLFGVPYDSIEVTVHPQSIIHSLVEFTDGSTIAQCSPPDMRLPISLGLNWPNRLEGVTAGIDWMKSHEWSFQPLDEEVFGAVRLARQVGMSGGTFPSVYNAANEVAVAAFNAGRIPFTRIVETIDHAVDSHQELGELTVEAIMAADESARENAMNFISKP